MKYIDIRGPHPILIEGLKTITLENARRDLTIEEAEELLRLNRIINSPTYYV